MSGKKVNYQLLGKMVKKVRKKAGLSQLELAEMVDISPQFMSKIENGVKQASLQTVYSIAKSLNVSMDLIMGLDISESNGQSAMEFILEDCTDYEEEIIMQLALAMKEILRKNDYGEKLDNTRW